MGQDEEEDEVFRAQQGLSRQYLHELVDYGSIIKASQIFNQKVAVRKLE